MVIDACHSGDGTRGDEDEVVRGVEEVFEAVKSLIIGDNGGLNIAFRALQNVMKTEKLGVKDGFTPEQRFFPEKMHQKWVY